MLIFTVFGIVIFLYELRTKNGRHGNKNTNHFRLLSINKGFKKL